MTNFAAMTVPDEIIILHYTRYGEKAVILHTLSQTQGRRSFIVKDASRLMPYFQPLNILGCETVTNPKSQLCSAKNFIEAIPTSGIRFSFGKNAISMFMAEVVYRAVHEGTDEPGLYEWLRSEIILLNEMECDYSNFHIRFLLDFAAAMGFSPSMDTLLPFLEDSATAVSQMMDAGFADSMLLKMTGAQRSVICTRLLKYLEFHLECPLHIRSLGVLGELFL